MTARRPCPPAPGPLEDFALQFDPLWASRAQRAHFRIYLNGLLLPRDRAKTLTGLAGAEPVVQAQAAPVQRLQFFVSESDWDAEAINRRRLELLMADPATAATSQGVLAIDDTGDRKEGNAIDHVARQYLGSVGKVDNGIVAVTSLWADERCYYPLHVMPYTPECRLAAGKRDPAFRTKPKIALELIAQAEAAGVPFKAIVADCAYGDNVDFEEALDEHDRPYVLAQRGHVGHWAPVQAAHSFEEAAHDVPLSAWTQVVRRFRDGHTERWWATDLTLLGYGPDRAVRAICATTDRRKLPNLSTWYLTTNLGVKQAPLDEIVRLYGLRNWIEQSYKQTKDELGWADFMVRSDRAIRRHWILVYCAFSFCWWHETNRVRVIDRSVQPASPPAPPPARKKNRLPQPVPVLDNDVALGTRLASPGALAHVLLARVRRPAPAMRAGYTR
ncbi:IS701 family transposase [Noviherbaspirillum sp. Root189]|uniref:IS701 family transposase n=1 Tax=Noviherbaspirillum sp. Root189 TaxID=1736487 RepID=UPI0009EB9611|nr:IS701 family transposase [Noviherbaspirillum sp. Root189]